MTESHPMPPDAHSQPSDPGAGDRGADDRRRTVESLLNQLKQHQHRRPAPSADDEVWSTGLPELDQLLPLHGWKAGMLVEWLHAGRGSGATTLALYCAQQIWRQSHTTPSEDSTAQEADQSESSVVIIDADRRFYPPAWAQSGMPLQQVIVVHPETAQQMFWAWEQALRTPGVAVAVCWVDQLDDRVYRRLKLATESSGTVGFAIRHQRWRTAASWADLRLGVSRISGSSDPEPNAGHLQVELLYARGSLGAGCCQLVVPPA